MRSENGRITFDSEDLELFGSIAEDLVEPDEYVHDEMGDLLYWLIAYGTDRSIPDMDNFSRTLRLALKWGYYTIDRNTSEVCEHGEGNEGTDLILRHDSNAEKAEG